MNNTQETHLNLLRHLEKNPNVTQRELAQELGISLGKANYCLKALINKGLIKAKNFVTTQVPQSSDYPEGITGVPWNT